jgi:hypothetical protein
MAKLIVKSQEQGAAKVIELKAGVTRFGRSTQNDYPLNYPAVSERHCEVLVDHDFVFVRDLGSTNGTYINRQPITEAALYSGQTLQIGPLEMVLDTPEVTVAIPDLPPVPRPEPAIPTELKDGYAACLNHMNRHAVWECTFCGRCHCDECVRKLRRVGGVHLKLCPACSNPCKLSPWSEMLRGKKKSLLGKMVTKIKNGFKMTKQLIKS